MEKVGVGQPRPCNLKMWTWVNYCYTYQLSAIAKCSSSSEVVRPIALLFEISFDHLASQTVVMLRYGTLGAKQQEILIGYSDNREAAKFLLSGY